MGSEVDKTKQTINACISRNILIDIWSVYSTHRTHGVPFEWKRTNNASCYDLHTHISTINLIGVTFALKIRNRYMRKSIQSPLRFKCFTWVDQCGKIDCGNNNNNNNSRGAHQFKLVRRWCRCFCYLPLPSTSECALSSEHIHAVAYDRRLHDRDIRSHDDDIIPLVYIVADQLHTRKMKRETTNWIKRISNSSKNESQHKAILHPMICHEFAKNVRCISIRQFEIVENRPILAWNDVVNVFKLDTMYTPSVSYVHHLPHCCCEIQTHSIQPPFTAYALVHLRVCACMSLAATFYSATT